MLNRSKFKTLGLAFSVTLMAISIIIYPEESFDASTRGLEMWWGIVFPSLLPFFIISEVMIGFGVVKFIGVLLEPFMRPLFRVPGVGGFVWAMGMASGFPSGAKLTARLRQEGQLTRIEAERLVSFTNCSNPLFIFGAVSVGFFMNPGLGILLAVAHYLANICVGLLMRFHGREEERNSRNAKKRVTIKTALSVLHQTRLKDKRPIGMLLGDAVTSSIQTLLMIGGFIILFSVINKLLFHLHITAGIAYVINHFFSLFSFPDALSIPFISGIFEITLGSQMTSQTQEATLLQQAIIVSFVLAFSGLSVQAQVASILARTDIRFRPFFIARLFQGMFAAIFTFIFWKPLYGAFDQDRSLHSYPVFEWIDPDPFVVSFQVLETIGPMLTIMALTTYCVILLARQIHRN